MQAEDQRRAAAARKQLNKGYVEFARLKKSAQNDAAMAAAEEREESRRKSKLIEAIPVSFIFYCFYQI